MEFKPHEYQQKAIDFILERPASGLFIDMGGGKTVITLKALSELAKQNKLPPGHILIVAPKNIARSTWPAEMEKWDEFKNVRHISLIENEKGTQLTKKKRDELLAEIPNNKPSFYFINRELLTYLIEYSNKHFKGKWFFPTVIIDELQSFKSSSSKRFKALRTIIPKTKIRIGLTGTPAAEGLDGLWAEIYFLDGGKRLGKYISHYRERWFIPGRVTPQGYPYEWFPKPTTRDDIMNAISDIVCSIPIPKDKPNIVPILYKMSDKEWKKYKKLATDKILNENTDQEITAMNAAVLAGKLMQAASGAIYPDESKPHYENIHNLKIEMLQDIIDHEQGNNILCFYWFKHELDRILKVFPDAHVFTGKSQEVKDWNAGKYKLMLVHPASAGHGLNFQEGGHIIVWFQLPWSLEMWLQGNARLNRQGQQYPVTIYQCLVKDTIDEKIAKMLSLKENAQQQVLDAVALDTEETSEEVEVKSEKEMQIDAVREILSSLA